jgi:hypothetical protein
MKLGTGITSVLLVGIMVLIGGPLMMTTENSAASDSADSLQPQPRLPANAENCVEPTEIMRRNHMDYLLHQRDATVIDGIRSKKHSLTGCLNCHNPQIDGDPVVRYENPEHFCAGCHLYTSVKIDCFECHSDRGEKAAISLDSLNTAHTQDDRGYLSLTTWLQHTTEKSSAHAK